MLNLSPQRWAVAGFLSEKGHCKAYLPPHKSAQNYTLASSIQVLPPETLQDFVDKLVFHPYYAPVRLLTFRARIKVASEDCE